MAAAPARGAAAVQCRVTASQSRDHGFAVAPRAPALRLHAPCVAPRPAAAHAAAGAPAAGAAAASRLHARSLRGAAALTPRPPHAPRRRRLAARAAAGGVAAPGAAPPGAGVGGASLGGRVAGRVRAAFAPLDGLWGKLLPMSALFFFMAFANSVLDRRAAPPPRRSARGLPPRAPRLA